LIRAQLHHIKRENIHLAIQVFNAVLYFNNLCQGTLPNRFSVKRAGFQRLNPAVESFKPGVYSIKAPIHRVKAPIYGLKARIHCVKAREYSLLKRPAIWELSCEFFAHQSDRNTAVKEKMLQAD